MPFTLTKSLNSALVKTEPLTDTSNSGIPCVAKIDLGTCVRGGVQHSRYGRETRDVLAIPRVGLVLVGGASWYVDRSHRVAPSLLELCPVRGHHAKQRARLFIFEIPGCPSWSSSRILSLPGGGMTTRLPHSTQPSWRLSSVHLCW